MDMHFELFNYCPSSCLECRSDLWGTTSHLAAMGASHRLQTVEQEARRGQGNAGCCPVTTPALLCPPLDFLLLEKSCPGRLGGSVRWASDSWFGLNLRVVRLSPMMGSAKSLLETLSLSPSAPTLPVLAHMSSLSKK